MMSVARRAGERARARAPRIVLAALLSGPLLAPPDALACSICRCGDPTFNALGSNVFSSRRFRLAFDWERFDKEQGLFADGGAPEGGRTNGHESLVEHRFTALASYGFGRGALYARVPWSSRDLTEAPLGGEPDRLEARGLSDPELYGALNLWSSDFASGLGRRASIDLVAGVKAGWGENNVSEDGRRLDEHAQPGTGATDVFGGLSTLYLLDKRSALFASAQYRHPGTNEAGYRYGDVLLANLAYERKLAARVDGVLELNFRHAGRDIVEAEGQLDPHTGGSLLYLTPRLLVDLGGGVVARLTAQLPVARGLNGEQTERAVFNLGLTYFLGSK